jgi:hypothetical protein
MEMDTCPIVIRGEEGPSDLSLKLAPVVRRFGS